MASTLRDTVLSWWALHPDATAADVAAHFNADPTVQRSIRPATLRKWKQRHGAGHGIAPPPAPRRPVTPPEAVTTPAPAVSPSRSRADEAQWEAGRPAAVWADIATINPWPENPRDNDNAVEPVADSIMRFGYGRTFVGWRSASERMLIVGHTARKAVLLNLKRYPGRTPPGAPAPHLIPVRWRDTWTDAEARGYAIADNQLATLAGWMDVELARQLRELEADGIDHGLLGWADTSLDSLLASLDPPPPEESPSTPGDPPPPTDNLQQVTDRWAALGVALRRAEAAHGAPVVLHLQAGLHVCDADRLSGPNWKRPYAEGGAVLRTLPAIHGLPSGDS